MEGVERHPVRAHQEDGFVVHAEAELALAVRDERCAIELDLADARAECFLRNRLAAAQQRDVDIVEVLRTCVPRIPEARVAEYQGHRAGGVPHILPLAEQGIAAAALDLDCVVVREFAVRRLEREVEIDLRVAALREHSLRIEERLVEAGRGFDRFERDAAPETARNGTAENVPAEGRRRLADGQRGEVVFVGERGRREEKPLALRLDHRGADMDEEFVVAGL